MLFPERQTRSLPHPPRRGKLTIFDINAAGFGADSGAEKFLDIKCRSAGLVPDTAVIASSVRTLKHHDAIAKAYLEKGNVDAVSRGRPNLLQHIENITKVFCLPALVAINAFPADTPSKLRPVQLRVPCSSTNPSRREFADVLASAALAIMLRTHDQRLNIALGLYVLSVQQCNKLHKLCIIGSGVVKEYRKLPAPNKEHFQQSGMERVELEDSAFHEGFEIWATNPHYVFYVITPALIERLKTLGGIGAERPLIHGIAMCCQGNLLNFMACGVGDAFEGIFILSMGEEETRQPGDCTMPTFPLLTRWSWLFLPVSLRIERVSVLSLCLRPRV